MTQAMTTVRRLVGGALAVLGLLFVYLRWFRPWYLRWGATDQELNGPLPGDDLVAHPRQQATRALTIQAPAAKVWPWLAQIGQGRGGFYSYTWLENLIGCDIHNADRILPECQQIAAGDRIRLGPEGYPYYTIAAVEPERALVLRAGDPVADPAPIDETWTFVLDPLGADACRLIARNRRDHPASLANWLVWQVLVEPLHFVMEHRMLLGVRQRAEAAVPSGRASTQ
jgi:hypothetical protein